ncbi:chitobiase/beta-hexosaminidase C-terminal domain-containing protein [Clostridium sp. SHJSY1]|uniref:chitobiase/beta-hexosaminidase C-terminal domain-containing protein n=1 Tax=Clostridium sp. SHJSY1 TaxID=2942483 RepID=UPI002876BA5B|nr:chitobiase/beta-hexosaminidase C-terminal domain-containing protein [Clostridium sp. SHJSY1]MDS0524841.1 chitobiase/beta-hexosaminidase C-terminal domain-containing protein [Clostridium sp. SHJSY1]
MKFKKISSIFISSLLLSSSFGWTSSPSAATLSSSTIQNSTKRYIVKLKNKDVNASQVVSKYNGKFRHQFKNVEAAVVDVTQDKVQELKNDPNVTYVEEDNVVKVSATTQTNWGLDDIGAPASWQSGFTGKDVKIAVIDTGTAPHPDLIVSGGVNVINGATTTSYADDNGHGTHVSGIIAGKGVDNGVKGVAPDASLYSVKALNSTGSGYTSDIIAGIDWAIENKMDIISMSLGSSQSSISLESAVNKAYNNGVLVVAAAGNSGNSDGIGTSIEYPANYSSVIAVGAVDSTNTRAYFSSTGSKLEVSAPGVNVLSTYLNGSYVQMSGTSMATPFVAGNLALLKQKYPSYTNAQLRELLDNNISDLGVIGRDSLYGFGLIKAPINTEVPSIKLNKPIASVSGGSYTTNQVVALSDTTEKVSIYYTTDGSTPTTSSNIYTSPITINSTTTLKAIAVDANGNVSEVLENTYVINNPLISPRKPVASIPSGTYSVAQTVMLSDKTEGVSIYYTLDGTVPSSKSKLYSEPITISSTTKLKAIAIDASGNSSEVLSVSYKINLSIAIPTPIASIPSGTYKDSLFIKLYDKYPGNLKFYYSLDGSTPTTKSLLYIGYVNIKSSCTLKVIAVDANGNVSGVLINQYNIIKPPTAPKLSIASGIYKTAQTIILSSSTPGVSIYYTLNGSAPSAKSILYTGPIIIKNSTVIKAVAIDASGNASNKVNAIYIILSNKFNRI